MLRYAAQTLTGRHRGALFTALIAACGGGTAATPTTPPAPPTEAPAAPTAAPAPTAAAAATTAPAPTAAPATPATGSATGALAENADTISAELAAAFAGEYRGTTVTMTGPFTDADAVKFNQAIATFEELTGIDIQYEGSKEFEASISIRVDGGNPPDIADFPQPGLLANFVRDGKVIDVSQFISTDWLSQITTRAGSIWPPWRAPTARSWPASGSG
jgi:alpha-glucoside transport system substrate-binding protein